MNIHLPPLNENKIIGSFVNYTKENGYNSYGRIIKFDPFLKKYTIKNLDSLEKTLKDKNDFTVINAEEIPDTLKNNPMYEYNNRDYENNKIKYTLFSGVLPRIKSSNREPKHSPKKSSNTLRLPPIKGAHAHGGRNRKTKNRKTKNRKTKKIYKK